MKEKLNREIDDFTEEDKVQTNNFWDYKTEKQIIGTFVKWVKDAYGEHAVLTSSDEEVHLPSLTALNRNSKLNECKEGSRVKIVYLEDRKGKTSGRTYSAFEIYIKE